MFTLDTSAIPHWQISSVLSYEACQHICAAPSSSVISHCASFSVSRNLTRFHLYVWHLWFNCQHYSGCLSCHEWLITNNQNKLTMHHVKVIKSNEVYFFSVLHYCLMCLSNSCVYYYWGMNEVCVLKEGYSYAAESG